MPDFESRSLHLHTLESLLADLVSGRSILTSTGEHFSLADERVRSALEWYRKKGSAAWPANVSAAHGEDLVDTILQVPPVLPALPARTANANNRRLRLKHLRAHRFAGLHKFGTPSSAPEDYVHDFTSPLTLFEGRNGSGKTSLVNAIIWALTGQILRPQRDPETPDDFDCWVAPVKDGEEQSEHKLSPLTPMPNVDQYRPDRAWVPADTWVELIFVDENETELPIIRRSQSRSPQGKLKEISPDLSVLGVDPIAIRIGTVMPGLLPLLKVGSESELGKAVSQLTGLSALVDLAEHVRRSGNKIKEFVRTKTEERDRADRDYSVASEDLEKLFQLYPGIKPTQLIPKAPNDVTTEKVLGEITQHFESAKISSFDSARDILGKNFDATNLSLLSDLEKNTAGALERVSKPLDLPSAARLGALRQLSSTQLGAVKKKIQVILGEASELHSLAKNPSIAARIRLYARVAAWIVDHPDPQRSDDMCVVCGGDLKGATDPVTGKPIKAHIHEAITGGSFLSLTISRWAENARGDLIKDLPEALRAETSSDLPAHPCDLLRKAFIDELFAFNPFLGVLSDLKKQTVSAFDAAAKDRRPLTEPMKIELPDGCDTLGKALKRLDDAIRFAEWRHLNDELVKGIATGVIGRIPKAGEQGEKITLTGKLLSLQTTVKAAQPISDAMNQCNRLKKHLEARRAAEKRLGEYSVASAALTSLLTLGKLADEQVNQLRNTLRKEAAEWRSKIYLGAFPDTAHKLVDTGMGRKGELDLVVQTAGVSAPAQHVTNASALRASLVAFFLAFWEYVLKERGGLVTLILDDPQELLDDENRERLAKALAPLAAAGAQLIVTSYDSRFCNYASLLRIAGGIEHLEVQPATRLQPVLRTIPSLPDIQKLKEYFANDKNAEEPARRFADGCRVFFEGKLGDMFDDPAHSAWVIANPSPTLSTFINRLRPLVRSSPSGMYSADVFRRFADHPALADGSPVLELMNKAHHGRRPDIRAADVVLCADDLEVLLELVEQMYEECYRWRRRDVPAGQSILELPALESMPHLSLNVMICPDLVAFTQHEALGESQESLEILDSHIFDNTVAFYLRRPNFGFAAPAGSIAVVESVPSVVADRALVIARGQSAIYARRFVRGMSQGPVGLTAEVPDPRTRTPKTVILQEHEVAIHKVVGIIFEHSVTTSQGKDEAVLVDPSDTLKSVEVAFRVRDDSAVPLALDKQVVLGGSRIELDELASHKDRLVALTLDDGSSVFKRVGEALPGELIHLMQFESIGGLGSSQVFSVGKLQKGFRSVVNARIIIGVLYLG